ncbi:MAG: glycosyltransferase [Scytonema sp. PMC 1069.18]|nr:glycosyltransferase [Scytonema sp. PMC 1069.18]MEC4887306.1 glycosyltransferase [Scytonema sp. PMC 1070.18]
MIFVTLGTIPFPFDRAVLWLDVLLERKIICEPVFLQYGTSNISDLKDHSLVNLKSVVSSEEINQLVSSSRLVISHAGQGSIKMLAAKGASFVLLPRLKKFGEHIDDHQLWFAQSVVKYGIQHCLHLDDLAQAVLQPPPFFKGQLFDEPKLTDYLLTKYPPKEKHN